MKRASVVVLLLLGSLVAVPASRGQTAPPETLPSDTVARVWATPILKADFDHWMVIAAASSYANVPAPGTRAYTMLRDQVISLLVASEWVEGESATRHISVSDAAVRGSFTRTKRRSFPREADYQEFLRRSHLTEADVLRQVRINLLSDRLRDKVVSRAKTAAGQQRLLDRFIKDFTARWRTVTVCGEAYATDDCGRTVQIVGRTRLPSANVNGRW
jgi:hypothetical protein